MPFTIFTARACAVSLALSSMASPAAARELFPEPSTYTCFPSDEQPKGRFQHYLQKRVSDIAKLSNLEPHFDICATSRFGVPAKADLQLGRLVVDEDLFKNEIKNGMRQIFVTIALSSSIHLLFGSTSYSTTAELSDSILEADRFSGKVASSFDIDRSEAEVFVNDMYYTSLEGPPPRKDRVAAFRDGWTQNELVKLASTRSAGRREDKIAAEKTVLDRLGETMEYVAKVGGGVAVLYGLYRWLLTNKRPRSRRVTSESVKKTD